MNTIEAKSAEGEMSVAHNGGVHPQACGCASGTGSAGESTAPLTLSHVYALGRIDVRFPSLGLEKEFVQATGREDTGGKTDRQAMHAVLSKPVNRYLARAMCWVFSIEGLETYILHPRDPGDLDQLIAALRGSPRAMDVDVVIGVRGPFAPPEMCNGLQVPIVVFDQIYSFDVDSLIKAIPRPKEVPADQFTSAAEELFHRIMQLADNAGATDDHRAFNYLAVRCPAIYALVAAAFDRTMSLTAVDVRPSRLSGTRKVVDVILTLTHRTSGVEEKHFVRTDVTERYPFLVSKLMPYYDR